MYVFGWAKFTILGYWTKVSILSSGVNLCQKLPQTINLIIEYKNKIIMIFETYWKESTYSYKMIMIILVSKTFQNEDSLKNIMVFYILYINFISYVHIMSVAWAFKDYFLFNSLFSITKNYSQTLKQIFSCYISDKW